MKKFSQFVELLDTTNSTNKKVKHLTDYFNAANDDDKLHAIALLAGRRPKRGVSSRQLREWAAEESGLDLWLFEESYHIVGDLAETIALLLPPPEKESNDSLTVWIDRLNSLKDLEHDKKEELIRQAWKKLDKSGRFVFNKLITGGFRIGISQKLMVRALSIHSGIDENELAHRLMGNWEPSNITFKKLLFEVDSTTSLSKPYPFYLAYPLEGQAEDLGKISEWSAEFKWDGIRAQLIIRKGEIFIWSRGEELVTHSFPELDFFRNAIPDGTVIDGELIGYKNSRPLLFSHLQKRLNRKRLSKALLKKVPISIIAYDLLEWQGKDIRSLAFSERRKLLKDLCSNTASEKLVFSEEIEWNNWKELEAIRNNARDFDSEGLMIKRKNASYKSGRRKGEWWKWKTDPLLLDGVLIYAMRGKGRRTNLFTDYTFGAWDGDRLIPFAKAYSGLTDTQFRSITSFVRRNTIERHGPVHAVEPQLVFEIAFDGIAPSSRHKSGVALRFPRMKRWRKDKPPKEAVTLKELHKLCNRFTDGKL